MLPVLALTFAVILLTDLSHFRLKRVVCEVAGAVIFFNALYVILRWGDDIHFFLSRPFYVAQIASLEPDKNGRKTKFWRWDGSMNTDSGVYYDYGLARTALPRVEDDGYCKTTRRSLGGHFELTKLVCYR